MEVGHNERAVIQSHARSAKQVDHGIGNVTILTRDYLLLVGVAERAVAASPEPKPDPPKKKPGTKKGSNVRKRPKPVKKGTPGPTVKPGQVKP